jgi:hypothetical protein
MNVTRYRQVTMDAIQAHSMPHEIAQVQNGSKICLSIVYLWTERGPPINNADNPATTTGRGR